MKDFHKNFKALLGGAELSPPRLALPRADRTAWEVAGEHTWARVLAGHFTATFRPRWVPSLLVRELAPARLHVPRPALIRPGGWKGAPRLRRPAALTG